ncbi:MAG: Hint domain-containing protein, partial [Pseudomonadota bacterium]
TAAGVPIPVTWIGRQTLQPFRHGAHMQPVRIRAGALGHRVPCKDLVVTADHGMVFPSSSEAVGETNIPSSSKAVGDTQTGYVINASALVNDTTVGFVPMAELGRSFTVYHIETEHHDVILANGTPSETFIDATTRSHFDNYQEYLDLYGADRIIREIAMPRIATARLVPQAIRARLGFAAIALSA